MSSVLAKVTAAMHRPARWGRRVLRWLLGAVAVLWLLLLTLWLILHWAILPNVDRWRPELEARASQWTGSSVRIGALSLRTSGWMPVIELRDLRWLDAQGQPALVLPQASAALSARSFLSLTPRLEQLYLHEPQLTLRRDAQGGLWIGGLQLQAQGEGSAFSDWLFSQHEIAIKGARVSWIDERLPETEALQLQQVDAVLRNGLRKHEARLDATPPRAFGERFSLRARFTQPLWTRAGDWRHWDGLAYAELPQADLAVWHRHWRLPLALRSGQGRLQSWAQVREGSVQAVQADVALQAVDLRLTAQTERLLLPQLHTRLQWTRTAAGSRWQASGLQFSLGEGAQAQVWPASQFTLSLSHAPAEPWQVPALRGGQWQADRLDLQLLAALGRALPLGAPVHEALAAYRPQGLVRNLDASWQGAWDDTTLPERWRLSAVGSALAWQPQPAPEPSAAQAHPLGRPGARGADLTLSASELGGQARWTMREGQFAWPGLLADPLLPLREAELALQWRRAAPGAPWQLTLQPSRLVTPDASLRLSGQWQALADDPLGRLQLTINSPRLDVRALPRYMPELLPQTRRYLAESLLEGQLLGIEARIDGALRDFPFAPTAGKAKGLFQVRARAEGLRYAYVPSHPADAQRAAYASPWPALDGVHAELLFDGPSLRLRNGRARIGALEAHGVQARIDDLTQHSVLHLEGNWRGPAAEALAFVQATPLQDWTAQALARARAQGAAQGRLNLQLPLLTQGGAHVQGEVSLSDALLQLRPELPALQQLRARLLFTDTQLTLAPSTAQLLGGELRAEGGTQSDGSLRILASGNATAEGLRQAVEWAPLPQLAQALQGATRYSLRLQWRAGEPDHELRSSLQGLASQLPAPLGKAADAPLPLRLAWQGLGEGRERLSAELGPLLAAQYELQRESPGLRGALRVGAGELVMPTRGVALHAALPSLDLDAWAPWAQRLQGTGADQRGGHFLPDHGSLQTAQLRVQGRTLKGVVAGVTRDEGTQRISLEADRVAGYLAWTPRAGAPGLLQGRLTRLSLPKSETERVAQWVDEGAAARIAWPQVDLIVDALELRDMKLGRLQLQTQGAAPGQPWRIDQLQLQHADAVLKASGEWLPATKRTQLDWHLAVANSGRLLDSLGIVGAVRGGQGELKGLLSWSGSPLSPEPALFDGRFSVQLGSGQFLKADPGVARLLGVLSLQSLPRRLWFDWRDVFSDGFAFDDFGGDVRIDAGVARSSNLRMRGVQATVLMDGSADLAQQTTDLRVLVVPEVNVGGATLAYAAINPAVGLTTFLAQLLLRRPLTAANTTHFQVRGPWATPQVDKIETPPPVAPS